MASNLRASRRSRFIREYSIGPEYMNSYDGRYFAVLSAVIEGESNAGGTFETLDEAAEWLTVDVYDEYPRTPTIVIDLDTLQRYTPEVECRTILKKARRR